jgi:AsmA protein
MPARKLLIIASIPAALILLVVAVLLVLPLESFRAPAERAVSHALGRDVHIAGAMHISLYPEIGLSGADVSIANVPGGGAKEFAHVGTLTLGAKLMPLLSHELDITKLVLEHPVMHLEVDQAGVGNWNFNLSKSSDTSSSSARLSISGLKVTDGEISYFDARTGNRKQLSHANASLSLAAFDQPAIFNMDAVYDGEKQTVSGRINSPDTFVRKQPTQVVLDLQSRLLNLHFDGTVIGAEESSGGVNLSGPSVRELVPALASFAQKPGQLGAFSLVGDVSSKDRVYALKNAKLSLDGMKAIANLAVDIKPKLPMVQGDISLDRLDAASYMMGKDSDASAQRGWSNKPLSLSGLKLADADVSVTIGALTLGAFTTTRNQMKVGLRDAVLAADVLNAGIFGGNAKGRVVADASQAVPRIAIKLNVNGVAMKALLESAMKIDRIEGTGVLALDVTGSGISQQAIMSSLHGTSNAQMRNGTIHGVDLGAVARTIQNVVSLAAVTGEKSSTEFTEAGGTFTIANGVMHNRDFQLANPYLRMSGSGDINLGQRTLDFRVEPKLVVSPGGILGKAGIGVSFHVTGPWTKPSYTPDLVGAAVGLVGTAVDGGLGLGNFLGNVVGQKNGSEQKKKPGLNLNGLFGR